MRQVQPAHEGKQSTATFVRAFRCGLPQESVDHPCGANQIRFGKVLGAWKIASITQRALGAGGIANSTAARPRLTANTRRLNANLPPPLEIDACQAPAEPCPSSAAMPRSACSKAPAGWPPEISHVPLITTAGTERMPREIHSRSASRTSSA